MNNAQNSNLNQPSASEKNNESKNRTSMRGFASMDRQKQREIASMGGKAAHQQGTAHKWTSEEARQAGKKGGEKRSKARLNQQDQDRDFFNENL